MTHRTPPRRTEPLRWTRVAAGLLLAWLAGCGPGVGGTGTGTEPPLAVFGASATPVCNGVIAPALACASVTGAPSGAGTAIVVYAGATPLGRLRAVFDGQQVVASIDCVGWRFEGEWGTDPQGRQRYFGTLVRGTGGSAEPAQVSMQAVAQPTGGTLLRATVLDAGERVLLGPIELRPDGAMAPPACP